MTQPAPFCVIDETTDSDSVVFRVMVPKDCPFFEGHFPGHPVLPAIGQFAMLEVLAGHATGVTATLLGIDGLRLSRQVLPGDCLEVRLAHPDADGKARFEIRRDGSAVSRGSARFAVGAAG